jgi:hypothetical protein
MSIGYEESKLIDLKMIKDPSKWWNETYIGRLFWKYNRTQPHGIFHVAAFFYWNQI